MPKQKGIFKVTGTINGICYYKLNGEFISRKAVGPSKERITNDPAFAQIKSNNQEFGMASILSKAIRQGLPDFALQLKDTYMASRMSGVCRKIIQKGSGPQGEREANLHNCPEALIGFELNKHQPFSEAYLATPKTSANPERSSITISIVKSGPKQLAKPPKKAIHFQLNVALSMVSNYHWHPETLNYQPEYPTFNGLGTAQYTQPLDCNITHSNLNIQLQTPSTAELPTDVALSVWLGISYVHYHQNDYHPLPIPQAMQCIAVL